MIIKGLPHLAKHIQERTITCISFPGATAHGRKCVCTGKNPKHTGSPVRLYTLVWQAIRLLQGYVRCGFCIAVNIVIVINALSVISYDIYIFSPFL